MSGYNAGRASTCFALHGMAGLVCLPTTSTYLCKSEGGSELRWRILNNSIKGRPLPPRHAYVVVKKTGDDLGICLTSGQVESVSLSLRPHVCILHSMSEEADIALFCIYLPFIAMLPLPFEYSEACVYKIFNFAQWILFCTNLH